MIGRKAAVVEQTTKGIDFLMNKTRLLFLKVWVHLKTEIQLLYLEKKRRK